MKLVNRIADRLLGRVVPKATAQGCACNDCICVNGRTCCYNCWCQLLGCGGSCSG